MSGFQYGFGGRLKAEFPSQVIVDVTEVCNLACIHCPHPDFKKSEFYSAAYLPEELNTKIIDEVATAGKDRTQYVRYTSEGEPLVHPKAMEMMAYAKKRSGTMVTLTTNGKLMKPKVVEQLLATGIDLIDISLDAFKDETYAKIRVGGDLAVTRAHVLDLIKRKTAAGSHLKVIVSYIEQPGNVAETKDFEAFWKGEGADYVVVRKLHSGAGFKEDVKQRMWKAVAGEERKPCVYPWERVVLNPRGWLSFCPADWTHASSVIDYRTTTLAETWQGEFYRKLREAHLSNDFSRHAFCGQCPDWMTTGWPGEKRVYADMIEEFKARE